MEHSEVEEWSLRKTQVAQRRLARNQTDFIPENPEGNPIERVKATAVPYLPIPPPKPASKATETARPEAHSPYVLEVEVNCEECGGSGFDPGGVDPWGPEPCPACQGRKTQWITRNYLAEAFQIAANPDSSRTVERQHLVAIIQHCREFVSALVVLPELSGPRSGEHAEPRSSAKPITHVTRRKHEITFSPQRARSRKRAAAGG